MQCQCNPKGREVYASAVVILAWWLQLMLFLIYITINLGIFAFCLTKVGGILLLGGNRYNHYSEYTWLCLRI